MREPAHPWLARPDWAAGRVHPSGGSWSILIVIAVAWNAICLVVGYVGYPHLRAQVAAGEYLLLLLGFPLISVGPISTFRFPAAGAGARCTSRRTRKMASGDIAALR